MGDTVRLPNGKTMTRGRAQALGLLDASGDPRTDIPMTERETKAAAREQRAAEWRRSQGLDGPVTTSDGIIKAPKKPKPLQPRNVDAKGQTVLLKEKIDPETKDVIQVPVDDEQGLGTGTPVEEAATLPSGDARVEAEDGAGD